MYKMSFNSIRKLVLFLMLLFNSIREQRFEFVYEYMYNQPECAKEKKSCDPDFNAHWKFGIATISVVSMRT